MTQPVGNCPGCGGDELFEQVHPGACPDVAGPDGARFDVDSLGAATFGVATFGVATFGVDSRDVDGECPEWFCVGCGAGVFMGIVNTATAGAPVPAGRAVRAA